MKEKTLLKISLIFALVGVFVLYLLSDSINIDQTAISKIKSEEVGNDVKVTGIVKNAFNGEKVIILTITQPEDIKVTIIKNNERNISLKEGDYIEVIGEIDEYNGEKRLMGNRLRVIG